MANAFAVEKQRRFGGPQGKSYLLIEGILTIDTTALGGASVGDMPASMFGLKKITSCLSITNDGQDKTYYANPDYTGGSLLVGGGASNANQDLPNDIYRIKLVGT